MAKEIINPPNVHRPRGFSHAIKVGNIIYVAGQAGLDESGKVVAEGDIIAQTERAYENLKRVLEAAGATIRDIVKLDIYTKDFAGFMKTGEVRRKYFGNHFPAAVAVGVTDLGPPGSLIEVDAIAIVD